MAICEPPAVYNILRKGSSQPTQTPESNCGLNPINQPSALSFVVPVLPPNCPGTL